MKASGSSHDMESFLEYKMANKDKSESQARALVLRTKHQTDLDRHFKKVDAKRKELSHMEYESRKIKKQVWDQLLLISQAVEKMEKERYECADLMRRIKEAREKARREAEQNLKLTAQEEKELRNKIKTTEEESEYYFEQKEVHLEDLGREKEKLWERMKDKEPTVKQYYEKKFSEEVMEQEIDRLRNQSKEKMSQIAALTDKLEALNKKAMEALKNREQLQSKEAEKKRQSIVEQIEGLDIMLGKKVESEQEMKVCWQILVKKKEQFKIEGELEIHKYEQMKIKIVRSVNESVAQQCEESIKASKRQLEQIGEQERAAQKKCKSLTEEEAAKDREVKNLQETINKISQNLNKR